MIIILNLIVLACALISLISYLMRRRKDRSALQALRGTQAIRTLDNDERQALEPLRQRHQVNFVSGQVFRLSGSYLRHGISTDGSETLHDTIGGVEVLLPFDAAAFLDTHNDAEVVITAKFAIVVRLNGFHVVEGHKRAQEEHAREQAWEAGQVAPPAAQALPAEPKASNTAVANDADDDASSAAVEILAQRKQTAEEAEEDGLGGLGFSTAGLWLTSFLLLWLASHNLAWAWLALPAIALAIWWPRRAARKTTSTAGGVNQVHGPLNLFMSAAQDGKVSTHPVLGETRQVHIPKHWLLSGRIPWGERLHMEISTRDSRVLGLGKGWSLADERRRFPRVRWGKHVTLLVTALVGLLLVVLNSNSLAKDLNFVRFGLLGSELRTDGSAASLQQKPPQPGDRIQVQGQAHCELALTALADGGDVVVLPDCSRMRWGGQPVALPEMTQPDAIARLRQADFLESVEDPMARLADLMLPSAEDSIEAILARADGPGVILVGMARLIDAVEAACEAGLGECPALQAELVDSLGVSLDTDDSGARLDTWPVLARELRRLADSGDDHMRTRKERINEFRRVLRKYTDRHLAQQLQQMAPQLLSAQQGGVVLIASGDLRVSTSEDPAYPPQADTSDLFERWEQARRLAATTVPFSINGMILDRHEDAAGLRLEVDTATDSNRAGTAWINTLWLLLAMTLVVYHATLLYRRILQMRTRKRDMVQDMQNRPVPGGM